ncbi:hypothetical protein [Bacillus thuringiensis]
MSRKVYDRQFKMAAVLQLVLEENMFVKEVSRPWKRTLSFSV